MRTLSFVAVLALVWGAASGAQAQYRDTSGDMVNPEKAINQSRSNTHIQMGTEDFGARSYRAQSVVPSGTAAAMSTIGRPLTDAEARAAVQGRPDAWRYRYSSNRWWYYMPNQHWMVWNGSRWNEHITQATPGGVQSTTHQ
jgi:hypothetical protein